ncbi:uncharacterized protein DUF2786 [Alteromonas sp. 76-1]|uniref:DUF2786 domain-containing protein n=1 Tax=Alteromonas sp. 76-1 TaxID=2358187 RepID=UPI000FD17190|nr:DUF2786 domain-containing protein [Alteromonas sp. 76-1]VEL96962.1 uncharacterized protein DUF2786 [Alteromonas sp. 76-1]
MNLKRIKDKISKLIALATSTSNEHEAQNAMSKALSLMARYHVCNGDLEKPEFVKKSIAHRRRVFKKSETLLHKFICEAFGVYGLFASARGLHAELLFIGVEADIDIAEYTFDIALTEIDKLKAKFKADGYTESNANSYKTGLCVGLGSRLLEASKSSQSQVKGHGLICVDNRIQAITDWYEGSNKVYMSRSKISADDRAMREGLKDSDKIHINKGVENSTQDTFLLGQS